jgi:hypothetical protein
MVDVTSHTKKRMGLSFQKHTTHQLNEPLKFAVSYAMKENVPLEQIRPLQNRR